MRQHPVHDAQRIDQIEAGTHADHDSPTAQDGAANGTQIAVDSRSGPDATPTMGEPSQGLSEADLATIAARLLAEVRRLRAHHEHCAWGACDGCEDVALERDAAQAEVERLRVRVAELEQALATVTTVTTVVPISD